MRLLQWRREEETATTAYRSSDSTPVVGQEAGVSETDAAVQEQRAEEAGEMSLAAGETLQGELVSARQQVRGLRKQQRRRRGLLTRRQKALVTLVAASGVGIRWYVANQEPVYPAGVLTAPVSPLDLKMDGPNAAHFYGAGVDALPANLDDGRLDRISVTEQLAEVARAAESLALVRQGFAYRYQGVAQSTWMKTTPQRGLSAPVPNYAGVRKVARLLAADARVKAASGDTVGALWASLDAVRFGQDIASRGNSLIEGMVGTLGESIGSMEAQNHIEGLSASEARAAIRRLDGLLSSEVTFEQMMASERRFGYEALQEVSADRADNLLADYVDFPSYNSNYNSNSKWSHFVSRAGVDAFIFWYGKQGTVNAYTSGADAYMLRAALPYQQAKVLGEVAPSKNPLVRIMVPNTSRAHASRTRVTAMERVVLARLAVQAYRAEHGGAAPASLEELTQGESPYLRGIPIDPFSADGTAPLRYENGLAYSVGENGQNDYGAGDDTLDVPSPAPHK